MAWGVWLSVPNDGAYGTDDPDTGEIDETAPATAAAFASGNAVFGVKAALTGTATFVGSATGLYSAAGMVEYFDADATLEADFGSKSANDSTPASFPAENDGLLHGAVTGTISNIKAGGMDVDGSLTLGRAPLIGAGADANAEPPTVNSASGFSGSTEGTLGGRAMSGNWGGQFYGKNKAPVGSVATRTEFPTGAAGTFGATTSVGPPGASILGAFGAHRQEAPATE